MERFACLSDGLVCLDLIPMLSSFRSSSTVRCPVFRAPRSMTMSSLLPPSCVRTYDMCRLLFVSVCLRRSWCYNRAAETIGCRVHGITLSKEQMALAEEKVKRLKAFSMPWPRKPEATSFRSFFQADAVRNALVGPFFFRGDTRNEFLFVKRVS